MYPINYRGGWMQPVAEYVPEVRKSRPTWKPNSKLPDYGPVIDEAPRPRQSFEDRAKSYQKIQYSEPFHTATPVIEFVNEPQVNHIRRLMLFAKQTFTLNQSIVCLFIATMVIT